MSKPLGKFEIPTERLIGDEFNEFLQNDLIVLENVSPVVERPEQPLNPEPEPEEPKQIEPVIRESTLKDRT